jgi:glycosyltransferase involved in cell wall biosynthesis
MRIIIIDDASPDCTVQVVRTIIAGLIDDCFFEIELKVNPHNLGVVKNLAALSVGRR